MRALDGLERSFRDILGAVRLRQLERTARDLYRALHLEDEVFEIERLTARLAELLERPAGRTA